MAGSRSTAKRDLEALKLREGGMSFDDIAEVLGFANRGSAHKAFRRALEGRSPSSKLTREEAKQLELARLDNYTRALTAKASRGDLGAMDRLLKISNQRARLQGLYESVNAPAAAPAGDGEGAEVIDMATAAARIREAVQGGRSS